MKKVAFILIASLFILLSSCSTKSNVNICKCLFSSGNSSYMKKHEKQCDQLINKELGVHNWKNINFSLYPDLERKFDSLAQNCQHKNF